MDPQEGDAKDHPHHQSLWVSHGAVNHADFWLIEKNMGYQRHKSFETVQDGDVCAQFVESIEWVDNAQKPVMSEVRKVTIWALPENARAIDFEITFIPNYGDVTFGDTKEGGLISLRVASSMQENTPEKKKGGTIFNANEQEGEKNAWGKPLPGVITMDRLEESLPDSPSWIIPKISFSPPTTMSAVMDYLQPIPSV